ncbi:hypothetical protein EW146_g6103 [Bondarzewia mesenterica]|uniref:Uncharacterized protein n=1 Tax=Bondarzewia mesenterica TaxID=1095465 RepID=A0A4S4LRE1_9AGAM|nr:hypothetical protein EW146_g6103 [Bondarzewia mesenterica]
MRASRGRQVRKRTSQPLLKIATASSARQHAAYSAIPTPVALTSTTRGGILPVQQPVSADRPARLTRSSVLRQPLASGDAIAPKAPSRISRPPEVLHTKRSFLISTATFSASSSGESVFSAQYREIDAESLLAHLERTLRKYQLDLRKSISLGGSVPRAKAIRRVNHVTAMRVVKVERQRLQAWACSTVVEQWSIGVTGANGRRKSLKPRPSPPRLRNVGSTPTDENFSARSSNLFVHREDQRNQTTVIYGAAESPSAPVRKRNLDASRLPAARPKSTPILRSDAPRPLQNFTNTPSRQYSTPRRMRTEPCIPPSDFDSDASSPTKLDSLFGRIAGEIWITA